jgi:hypothetical protein
MYQRDTATATRRGGIHHAICITGTRHTAGNGNLFYEGRCCRTNKRFYDFENYLELHGANDKLELDYKEISGLFPDLKFAIVRDIEARLDFGKYSEQEVTVIIVRDRIGNECTFEEVIQCGIGSLAKDISP